MTTENIVTIFAALLGSSTVSALVSHLLQKSAEKRRKYTGAEAGVRMLLYDRIKCLGLRYIGEGAVCSDSLEDLIEMHRIYHDELGGNGFLDGVMDQVKALPVQRRTLK